MSAGWVDVRSPVGTRREALRSGLTRIGGKGADIVLASGPALGDGPDLAGDELHLWDSPPRLLFLGRGARPTAAGVPFDERPLRPGDAVEWAGHELVFALPAEVAALEELPAEPAPARAAGASQLERGAQRVRAGLACELGLADAAAVQRWREAVLASRFEADACARELLPRSPGPEGEGRILERSGTLLRDFLMAALQSGAAGARRRAREKARSLAAFLVSQALALAIFTFLVVAMLFLLRSGGHSIDAWIDRWLPG